MFRIKFHNGFGTKFLLQNLIVSFVFPSSMVMCNNVQKSWNSNILSKDKGSLKWYGLQEWRRIWRNSIFGEHCRPYLSKQTHIIRCDKTFNIVTHAHTYIPLLYFTTHRIMYVCEHVAIYSSLLHTHNLNLIDIRYFVHYTYSIELVGKPSFIYQ